MIIKYEYLASRQSGFFPLHQIVGETLTKLIKETGGLSFHFISFAAAAAAAENVEEIEGLCG